jgi:hypothetical protein
VYPALPCYSNEKNDQNNEISFSALIEHLTVLVLHVG